MQRAKNDYLSKDNMGAVHDTEHIVETDITVGNALWCGEESPKVPPAVQARVNQEGDLVRTKEPVKYRGTLWGNTRNVRERGTGNGCAGRRSR